MNRTRFQGSGWIYPREFQAQRERRIGCPDRAGRSYGAGCGFGASSLDYRVEASRDLEEWREMEEEPIELTEPFENGEVEIGTVLLPIETSSTQTFLRLRLDLIQ